MTVSERDPAKMRRIAADLAESETDEPGTPEQRRAILAWINERRAEIGAAPLDDRAPEEGCMSEPDPSAWIASIAEILDDVGVDWAIVGALAANR